MSSLKSAMPDGHESTSPDRCRTDSEGSDPMLRRAAARNGFGSSENSSLSSAEGGR